MYALHSKLRLICDCYSCTLPRAESEISDQNRLFIADTIRKLAAKQPVPIETIEKAIEAAATEQLSGLAGDIKYLGGLQHIKLACFGTFDLAVIEKTVRWLRQYIKTLILCEGPDSPYVKEKQEELAQIESSTALMIEMRAQPLNTRVLMMGLTSTDSLFPNLDKE